MSILIQPYGVNDLSKDRIPRAKRGSASREYEGRLPERGLLGPQMPAQRAGAARPRAHHASGNCRMRMSEQSGYREYVSDSRGAALVTMATKKAALEAAA